VLTDELVDMVDHATRQIDTRRDELCLELIHEVGPQNHFLDLDHTLDNFRRFWHSNIFQRPRLSDPPVTGEKTVRDRINEKTRRIIETHVVEPLPREVVRELDKLERSWVGQTK
jgi:trimethylamine--corrinoid protein Co-methyltransferase